MSGDEVNYYIAEPQYYNIKRGNYLLFLNDYEDPDLNQTTFFNISPNHLYKQNERVFINVIKAGKTVVTEKEINRIVKKKEKSY